MVMGLLENAESTFRSREFRWSATPTYRARRVWTQASSACLYRTARWHGFNSWQGRFAPGTEPQAPPACALKPCMSSIAIAGSKEVGERSIRKLKRNQNRPAPRGRKCKHLVPGRLQTHGH